MYKKEKEKERSGWVGENRASTNRFRTKVATTEWKSVERKPIEMAATKKSLQGQTEQPTALGRSRGPPST